MTKKQKKTCVACGKEIKQKSDVECLCFNCCYRDSEYGKRTAHIN